VFSLFLGNVCIIDITVKAGGSVQSMNIFQPKETIQAAGIRGCQVLGQISNGITVTSPSVFWGSMIFKGKF